MKKQIERLIKFIPVASLLVFFPFVASAQEVGGLSGLLVRINNLLGAVVPVLVALGVVYFIWGVVQYFIGDSEEAKSAGRDRIIYGIIGLAVIISVWGLVYLLADTFVDQTTTGAPEISSLVTQTSGASCDLGPNSKLQGLIDYIICIIGRSVIPLIFAIAMVMFVWGAVKFFIIGGGEEEKRAQGKQFMLWGIIALAVMISVWGLVNILGQTFGLPRGVLPGVGPTESTQGSPSSGSGNNLPCWQNPDNCD